LRYGARRAAAAELWQAAAIVREPRPSSSATPPSPEGWRYEREFLSPAEQAALLATIATLPLQAARYKEWTARRRIVNYGGRYDFGHNRLEPAEPVPQFLLPLRARLAQLGGLAAQELQYAAVAEYQPGTQLGWHRDVPQFEVVFGVSLAGHARMRFRPYPHVKGVRTVFAVDLEPGSAYVIRDAVRWRWQHAISETHELRYSITFRSRRAAARGDSLGIGHAILDGE
jgi:alkylated DNA repair dioxygenase AlkB